MTQHGQPARRRVRLRITGRVQGVFFRAETRREARRLGGIHGYVRNLADGSVEVVAEGDPAQVEALIAWCQKGPPYARVQEVELAEEEPTGEEGGFHIAY